LYSLIGIPASLQSEFSLTPAGTKIPGQVTHTKVVFVANDMLGGGPQTPSNIKQLEVWAGSFLVLQAIVVLTRRRFPGKEDTTQYGA
jgi:hypothetical protein